MPMGVISNKDFERELRDSQVPDDSPLPAPKSDVIEGEVVEMNTPGRKEGDVNVPNSLRNLLGITSVEDGRAAALQLAEQFGVSPSSVSAYTEGATSTSTIADKPNGKVIDDAKQRIVKKASKVLNRALLKITDEKLDATKAVELAQIAKSMSGIVKDMEPENEGDKEKDMPQFLVYSPTIKQENHYDTIVVRE